MADEVQIGVMGIGAEAIAAGDGHGIGPVAEALVVEVIFPQGDLLGEEVQAPVVEHHGHGGGAADHIADGGVADHLAVAGRIQQDLFRQGAVVGDVDGDRLTVQRVFQRGGNIAQGGGHAGVVAVQRHLELDLAGGLTVGALDVEGIGIHSGQRVGGVGGAALQVDAPFAPGKEAAPFLLHVHIGPDLDLHPGAVGRICAPAGHQVFKGGDGDLLRGPDALLGAAGQTDRAVADLLCDLHILQLAGGKRFRGADPDKIVLRHIAPGVFAAGLIGKGAEAQQAGAQSADAQKRKSFFPILFHDLYLFSVLKLQSNDQSRPFSLQKS